MSARQGSRLAQLIRSNGYAWNRSVGGVEMPVCAPCRVQIGHASITVHTPRTVDLHGLAYVWKKELLKMGVPHDALESPDFEDAFESELLRERAIANDARDVSSSSDPPDPATFREDQSPTNASSISFALEFEGLTGLFLADAIPSAVLESLGNASLEADVVKVAHHGSRRNTSPALLDRVRGRCFIVSTDGTRHDHPDLGAMLWILSRQPGATLAFNYRTAVADLLAHPAAVERYQHRVQLPIATPGLLMTFRRSR